MNWETPCLDGFYGYGVVIHAFSGCISTEKLHVAKGLLN